MLGANRATSTSASMTFAGTSQPPPPGQLEDHFVKMFKYLAGCDMPIHVRALSDEWPRETTGEDNRFDENSKISHAELG